MNPELKAKWLAALRSNTYTQGRDQLYDPANNTYCCLGVLCEVANLKREEETYYHGNDEEMETLPESFREEAGISSPAMNTLTELNDFAGKTFPELAKWIEENL